jgi:hypothetical protein
MKEVDTNQRGHFCSLLFRSACQWPWGRSKTSFIRSLSGALGSSLSISPMAARAWCECLRLCWGWPSCLRRWIHQALTSFLVLCFGSIFGTRCFKPGELPLLDELGDVSGVVEGLPKFSIDDPLLLHLKNCDVHNLSDCSMVESLELPFAFGSQSPGFRSHPEGSAQWWLKAQQLLELLGGALVSPSVD